MLMAMFAATLTLLVPLFPMISDLGLSLAAARARDPEGERLDQLGRARDGAGRIC
ncbi:MAG: hypothetical protein U1E76_16440 [Planctomycetota bacterium]